MLETASHTGAPVQIYALLLVIQFSDNGKAQENDLSTSAAATFLLDLEGFGALLFESTSAIVTICCVSLELEGLTLGFFFFHYSLFK